MEKSLSLLKQIQEQFEVKAQDVRTYSPLVLAYIGDAVYEQIIRTILVSEGNQTVNGLHKKACNFVKAEAQAKMIQNLMEELSEEEQAVYRRGKNAKPHTTSKNGTVADYHKATGFEALVGYLYLEDKMDRVLYLVKAGMETLKQ
ncbi:MAG: ribonuclease III [Lachnospiraceae bacterium]|nr:ribonuclease III [Lachnospiraceae bacterium]MBR2401442.1 ribonuclease III [Lachnospiraceae bacterium]MBR3684277.1 ribonuclease III [Lachnospiraceae bacterium]